MPIRWISFEGSMHLKLFLCCFMMLVLTPVVSYSAIPSRSYVANAEHITENQFNPARLPIYNKTEETTKPTDTVAAGNDVRFNTVQIGQPEAITADNVTGDTTDRALIWIE